MFILRQNTVDDCKETSFPYKKRMSNVTYLGCGYNFRDMPLQIQTGREYYSSISVQGHLAFLKM